jgi:cytochrome bd-type quinol oxidase subunit 1
MFALIYALLFAAFVFLLHQKITHGPDEAHDEPAGKRDLPQLTGES